MSAKSLSALAAIIGLVLSTPAVLGVAAASGAVLSPPTAGLPYAALGDSYAAGFGLTPLTGQPDPSCGQASVDYPHQVADTLGLALTDVTCAGAKTADLTTSVRIAAQTSVLSAATKVVSVTIGGNDLGFAAIAQSCVAVSANGPLLADQTKFRCTAGTQGGATDVLEQKITNDVSVKLRDTFAAIAAAAPNARVFVVGYLAIFPATIPATGCFSDFRTPNSFPFTDADAVYLHGVETSLNSTIQKASTVAGFTYVPATAPANSADHSACAAPAAAFVGGITLSATTGQPQPFSLHPTAAGVASMAAQLAAEISTAFPVAVIPPVTPAVTPPITPPITVPAGIPAAPFSSEAGLVAANRGTVTVAQSGNTVTVTVPSAAAGYQLYVYGYSAPVSLGAHILNGAKKIFVDTSTLPAGAHHLVILGATGAVIGWAPIAVHAVILPLVSG